MSCRQNTEPGDNVGNCVMKTFGRAVVEIGFIVFLFYSNLLMGEFERSGAARQKGLEWALSDVFTRANLEIAIIAAAIGYIVVELIRHGSARRRRKLVDRLRHRQQRRLKRQFLVLLRQRHLLPHAG